MTLSFKNTELDAHLLATPFKVRTRWQVITGGPSCGKTTLIDLLSAKGFRTAPEGARLYLEREIARGRLLEEMRSDEASLQRGIKDMHYEIEHGLEPDDFIFLDRALPDCMAYYRVFGLDPNDFLEDCFLHHYATVFILERLPLDLDGLRYQDDKIQDFTEEWHTRDYGTLGYSIVKVPVLPPEERLEFVLEMLSGQGILE